MLIIDYLLAISIFVGLYLIERLVAFWLKKKPLWPLLSYNLLSDAICYTVVAFLLIGIMRLAFKKIDSLCLLWLDAAFYLTVRLFKTRDLFILIKNHRKYHLKQTHVLGGLLFVIAVLECFVFNSKAYSENKETVSYQNFVCEEISSDGLIEQNKIVLTNKQCLYITTNNRDYSNIYLSFDNDDMNLYVNIFEMKNDSTEYTFKQFALVDPKLDAYGYISLNNMSDVKSLKIEFDIDSSRYLNDQSKPVIVVDAIGFDEYFPVLINPLRMGGLLLACLIVVYFKELFLKRLIEDEQQSIYQKLERTILFGGLLAFVVFIFYAIINNSAYFIKYDDLYLGGTSSSNIYYQQFVAYLKGQLHLDVPVDQKLLSLENPYDPYKRDGITFLWDHAFYNGKYYCYYGHAPIFLVMFPIYWISGFVPSNLFILQLGVLLSVFAFLLAGLLIIKLFVKKVNPVFLVLTLAAMTFGSLLLTNNTYEYGGMIYRIPYAYANGFLFLTIYFLLKGYSVKERRFIYLSLASISVTFVALSRAIEALYVLLLAPLLIKMIIESRKDKEQLFIDLAPAIGLLVAGVALVCGLNYVRFDSVLEFGEHYQLTVSDCRKNALSLDGILPTIYHFFLQAPKYNKDNGLLVYRYSPEHFETHPYNTYSVGLLFIPVTIFMLLIPFVFNKNDSLTIKIFLIASPILLFFIAFISYCFAGVCPRYLNDFAPWAALTGGLVGLKAIEKNNDKHFIVPSLIGVVLVISVVITAQYHFIEFDGLRIGDYNGLLGIIKSITNQYNI